MFWGLVMQAGKKYSQKVKTSFHISKACVEPYSQHKRSDVAVCFQVQGQDYVLCTLNSQYQKESCLDLNFQSGDEITFFLKGEGIVHLTGYMLEAADDDSDNEDIVESVNVPSSPEKTNTSVSGTGKRKKEKQPQLNAKKVKIQSEEADESSDEDFLKLGDDSDEDDESEKSDEEMEVASPKQKTPEFKKNQMQSPQNKSVTPNEKQNKSVTPNEKKNKTPGNKTPNSQTVNTPNQKTPGKQMNGTPHEQSGKKKKRKNKGKKTPGQNDSIGQGIEL